MGTSSRESLAPGKTHRDNVHPDVTCCLATREKGLPSGISVSALHAEGDCHHSVPHTQGTCCSRDGNSQHPTSPGERQQACTCSVVLLLLWETPSKRTWQLCCISAAGAAAKIVPERAEDFVFTFLLIVLSFFFFPPTGIWIRTSPPSTANRRCK